jgi:hypothetical protein
VKWVLAKRDCLRVSLLEKGLIQGDQKVCAPDDNSKSAMKNAMYSNNPHTIDDLKMASHNTFGIRTVLYQTQSSRTQFSVSINVWRLVGDTLNITCNFLYCNHQVHRDFLIILYNVTGIDCTVFLMQVKRYWIYES